MSLYTIEKDQILETIKEFHILVERQSDNKLKCIHTNNGSEYCGSFNFYCKQQDITHEKTLFKTPQLNSVQVV